MSKLLKGYLFVFLGVLCWGIAAPLAKMLFTKHFDPFIVIQTRATFSFLTLLIILLLTKWELLKVKKNDLKFYILLGMIGMAGSNYFYYISMKYITVSTAIMIQYTTPFIVLIYSIIARIERYHYSKVLLLIVAFIALFFAISSGDLSYFSINTIGVTLAVLSALTWAFYNIFNKFIKVRYNDWTELLYIFGSTSLLWFIFNPGIFVQLFYFELNDLLILYGFALLSIMLPMFLYNSGLKYLRATQATTMGLSEPVIVVCASFIILSEKISLIQGLSGLVVLSSIFFLEKIRNKFDADIINVKYEN